MVIYLFIYKLGDVGAKTIFEQIFAIFWMIIGVGFYSITLGNITTLIMDLD